MSARTAPAGEPLQEALRQELLRLALDEEELAAREAQQVPYWQTMPLTVVIHRRCGVALRAAADALPTPSTGPAPAAGPLR